MKMTSSSAVLNSPLLLRLLDDTFLNTITNRANLNNLKAASPLLSIPSMKNMTNDTETIVASKELNQSAK